LDIWLRVTIDGGIILEEDGKEEPGKMLLQNTLLEDYGKKSKSFGVQNLKLRMKLRLLNLLQKILIQQERKLGLK